MSNVAVVVVQPGPGVQSGGAISMPLFPVFLVFVGATSMFTRPLLLA